MKAEELFGLSGKSGFITGAAMGIGKVLANGFADIGADVALVDLNVDLAQKVANEISERTGRKILAYECDVTDPKSIDKMMTNYLKDFGEINFAINNAGICINENAETFNADNFKKIIDINLNGVFFTAQAAGKAMIKQGKGGSIISTASMSAHIVNIPQVQSSYNASKAGVIMLSKSLAVEWAKYNIRVNTVSPGYTLTELTARLSDLHEKWIPLVPMKRLAVPEDLLGAYIYLASNSSLYTTGADIIVDGGYVCQ